MDRKYTVADVATSLNFGKPQDKSILRLLAALLALIAALTVAASVGIIIDVSSGEIPPTYLWIIVAMVVFVVAFIALCGWLLHKSNKTIKLIEECFDDAMAIRGCLCYEPHVFNDGTNVLTYVMYFSVGGVDYAVAPKVQTVVSQNKRNDLASFVDRTCDILYSPSHNEVLILKFRENGEIR